MRRGPCRETLHSTSGMEGIQQQPGLAAFPPEIWWDQLSPPSLQCFSSPNWDCWVRTRCPVLSTCPGTPAGSQPSAWLAGSGVPWRGSSVHGPHCSANSFIPGAGKLWEQGGNMPPRCPSWSSSPAEVEGGDAFGCKMGS